MASSTSARARFICDSERSQFVLLSLPNEVACRAVALSVLLSFRAKSRNLWLFLFVSEITQAFVLAAGLGTRLRPLTDDLPKPLIPIFQKPLITFALDQLISAGVNKFVINTHRYPELFRDFFSPKRLCRLSGDAYSRA